MAIYFQGQAIPAHTPEEAAQLERQRQVRIENGTPSWIEQWAAETGRGYEVIKIATLPNGARDITLSNGEVRHNVGGDNLSNEDRASMEADLQAWIDSGCPE